MISMLPSVSSVSRGAGRLEDGIVCESTAAHNEDDIERTVTAVAETLEMLRAES